MPRSAISQFETANPFKKQDAKGVQKKSNRNEMKLSSKRPANSPVKAVVKKRSAFGDITNVRLQATNKDVSQKSVPPKASVVTRKSKRNLSKCPPQPSADKKEKLKPIAEPDVSDGGVSSSQGSSSSSGSNHSFVSAMSTDDVTSERRDLLESPDSPTPACCQFVVAPGRRQLNYYDHDAANVNNVNESPDYAFLVFEYMRARERSFVIEPRYLTSAQADITPDMRAIVVDWMVEIQESFELNHETLYLAVKLLDHYLMCVKTTRSRLQLVATAALLIAAKFDERHPPYIDDFVYICDDTYSRKEVLAMERSLITSVGFDINIPIAYRFLRRYAKCSKTNMKVLTLARYILELTLHHYSFVHRSASLLAAASLWLAMKMTASGQWDDTLLYYSTHSERHLFQLASELNDMVTTSKDHKLQTARTKYSHSIFYEVAKTAPLTAENLGAEESRIFTVDRPSPCDKLFTQL